MRFKVLITIIAFMLLTITTHSTSKYEGVSWNDKRALWQVEFDFNGKKSKYYFENEHDATRTRNRVYKKMGILSQNLGNSKIPSQCKPEQKSQYKGVYYNKKTSKWYVKVNQKGQKQQKYGGLFNNQLDAAKKATQLYEEIHKNPVISRKQSQNKTSLYKGVYWHKENKQWCVQIYLKNGVTKYCGIFKDELNAAKRVNQVCEKLGIPLLNPGTGTIPAPNQQLHVKKRASQYSGVSWSSKARKWRAKIYLSRRNPKNGGYFKDELNAAKKVNQLCEEIGILHKNPGINGIPIQEWQTKKKTSQYIGVHWNKRSHNWRAQLNLKGGKKKYGGYFKDELDAAKRFDQLCEEFGIPVKNHETRTITKQADKKNSEVENSEITKTEHYDDGTNENKTTHKKDMIMNESSPVEKYYFYENLLK